MGKGTPTSKTNLVSTWVSSRMLQPLTEPIITTTYVASDFLVEGQVCWLGTVYPLLIFYFFTIWILPLSLITRKALSSVIDGFQKRLW